MLKTKNLERKYITSSIIKAQLYFNIYFASTIYPVSMRLFIL